MILAVVGRYAERERRPSRAREPKGASRAICDELEHPMLALQHSIGNRAVAGLARSLLLRQPDGQQAPQELHDVPIGRPPPAEVPATDLAAAGSPPATVTYTGPPAATAAAPTTAPTTAAAPTNAQAPAPDPAQAAPQTPASTTRPHRRHEHPAQ
jgi:hypothetical protein